MPVVNGQMKDFNLAVMVDKQPTVVFRPRGPGMSGTEVYASEPVRVNTAYATGNFSVLLADSETTGVLYDVALEWLSPGAPDGGGFRSVDIFEGLFVPPAGGPLANLLPRSPGRWLVWVDPLPPKNPKPGNLWLNSTTGDLAEWR